MSDALIIFPTASCVAWFWLLLFRHGFWRADQRIDPEAGSAPEFPQVVAIVPARDEADVIGRTVTSLVNQDYPGKFAVLLVDDHSEDGTAERARSVAGDGRVEILPAPSLATGWTGKLWALNYGVAEAKRRFPGCRYLLLTDADIEHAPDNLRYLVAHAEKNQRDLVSLMAQLHCTSAWERLLIPAFVFFFQKLYPFPAVNDDRSSTAAAAGGCILVRSDTLDRAGGLPRIRDALIDDCSLASLIKKAHGRLWLGLSDGNCRSVRPYRGLGDIWNMVARTAFTQLGHSWPYLAATIGGMLVIYVAGPAILLSYSWHANALASSFGLLAWLLMWCAYLPTLRLYRQPALLGFALPIAGVLYTAMTVDSSWRYFARRGGHWKGRTYLD